MPSLKPGIFHVLTVTLAYLTILFKIYIEKFSYCAVFGQLIKNEHT